jgi:hypothetical protein
LDRDATLAFIIVQIATKTNRGYGFSHGSSDSTKDKGHYEINGFNNNREAALGKLADANASPQ